MKLVLLGLISLFSTDVFAEGCEYVEAGKWFQRGQHGPLLVSYLNYTPRERDNEGNLDRSDDQFGVCRIMADGTVITSYGCAGEDHVDTRRTHKTNIRRLFAILNEGDGVTGRGFAPYRERLYERNQGELMTASTLDRAYGSESTQKSVKSESELAELIRKICPLDD